MEYKGNKGIDEMQDIYVSSTYPFGLFYFSSSPSQIKTAIYYCNPWDVNCKHKMLLPHEASAVSSISVTLFTAVNHPFTNHRCCDLYREIRLDKSLLTIVAEGSCCPLVEWIAIRLEMTVWNSDVQSSF